MNLKKYDSLVRDNLSVTNSETSGL